MSRILHKELSYAVVGCMMEAHREIGPGWPEELYHSALVALLEGSGLGFRSKARGDLVHRGVVADRFELDVLVEDRIILELKAARDRIPSSAFAQTLNYLKFWEKDLGIVANFGLGEFYSRRLPFTPRALVFEGDNGGRPRLCPQTIDVIARIRRLVEEYGVGYSSEVYERLFVADCQVDGLKAESPIVSPSVQGRALGAFKASCLVVNDSVAVGFAAGEDGPSATDFAVVQSAARLMGFEDGVLVNLRSSKASVHFVSAS